MHLFQLFRLSILINTSKGQTTALFKFIYLIMVWFRAHFISQSINPSSVRDSLFSCRVLTLTCPLKVEVDSGGGDGNGDGTGAGGEDGRWRWVVMVALPQLADRPLPLTCPLARSRDLSLCCCLLSLLRSLSLALPSPSWRDGGGRRTRPLRIYVFANNFLSKVPTRSLSLSPSLWCS